MASVAGMLTVITLAGCAGASGPKAFERSRDHELPSRGAPAANLNAPVVVAEEVTDGFRFLYQFVSETEFVLCLEGTRNNGRILVTSFRLARMRESTAASVKYEPCTSPDYVGTAHNHPPVAGAETLCYQSVPDRISFLRDARAIVDIVLCGKSTYLWVLKDGRRSISDGELVAAGTDVSRE